MIGAWRILTRSSLQHATRPVTLLPARVHALRFAVRQSGQPAAPFHVTRVFSSKHIDEEVKKREDIKSVQSIPAPEGELSIVFTDIVKSTQIWENDPEAMAIGMKIHDNILRTLTQCHEGYEVKQNGDGFMIAFHTAISALQFCLAVQQQLINQEWPEEIMQIQPGKETTDKDGQVLFRGLRLRMSAHWGKPVCIWNEVIERMDYLGPMVNRAARFVQVTEGGQIVVSEEFLIELRKSKKHKDPGLTEADDQESILIGPSQRIVPQEGQNITTDQHFEVRLLGEHQFKGLSSPQKLYFVIPQALSGRLEMWPKHKHVEGSKGNIVPS